MSYIPTESDLWQKTTLEGTAFTFASGFITIASASETDFVLLRNPSGSGNIARLKEFIMSIAATASQTSIFRFYRTPTITSVGTPITIQKVMATQSATSTLLAYQTPTISARGSLIQMFSIDFKTYIRDQDLSRYLVEGADLLCTVDGSTTNLEHNITMTWAEKPA